MTNRIAIIHATRAAIAPIEDAFTEDWPEAEFWNLVDEGLAQEIDRAGGLNDELSQRLERLAAYAAGTGVDGVLFSCAAYGPAIDALKDAYSVPILKPNEALIETVLQKSGKIGLLATHPPALPTMTAQIEAAADASGSAVDLHPVLVDGAWSALQAGRQGEHDAAVMQTLSAFEGFSCVALAQFSLAPLAAEIERCVGCPVLSGPTSAVRKIKSLTST